MPGAGSRYALRVALLVSAAATALPLLLVEFPPLVDLPQHASLVSILRHWSDPACGYPAIYEIDRFSPYWIGYLLAWAISIPLGVSFAVQLVLALSLAAIPLATARLLRAAGGDEAWALLVPPLAYGSPTAWGFFGFVVAIPIALWLLASVLDFVRAPSLARGAGLSAGFALLFFAHLLAFALTALVAGALLAAGGEGRPAAWVSVRAIGLRLAPLAAPVLLALLWLLVSRGRVPAPADPFRLGWSLDRLRSIPSYLTGIPGGTLPLMEVVVLLAALLTAGARWSRSVRRWLPFGLAVAVVTIGPVKLLGTALMPERFAILLGPLFLLGFEARDEGRRGWISLWAPLASGLALLAVVGWRYHFMDVEGAGLSAVLAKAPAGERLLYLPYDRASAISTDPVFAYAGSRYAVDRCGVAEPSFARYPHYPIRFREGVAAVAPVLPPFVEFVPQRFRWEKHGGDAFGLVLVRAAGEPDSARIAGGEGRLALLAQSGRWWLYENVERASNRSEEPDDPALADR